MLSRTPQRCGVEGVSCKRRVSLLDDSLNVSAHARPGFSDTFKDKRTLDDFLLHQLKPAETHLRVLTFVTYIKDLEVVAKQCIMDLERRLMCPPCWDWKGGGGAHQRWRGPVGLRSRFGLTKYASQAAVTHRSSSVCYNLWNFKVLSWLKMMDKRRKCSARRKHEEKNKQGN